MSDGDWFAPKRFGYGAGLPIAWQGWAVLGAYLITVAVTAAALMPRHPYVAVTILVAATLALATVSAQHTRGGWKWRWRGEE
ncbi:MAG: hypothetical protein ABIR08_01660 [Sphingomonas sp.]